MPLSDSLDGLDTFRIRRLIQNPYKIVGEYVKEGQTVLDLGCGPGFFGNGKDGR